VKWSNCQLQARNALQRALANRYATKGIWERTEDWNSVTHEIKPFITAFADTLLPRIPLSGKFQKEAKQNLEWDFLFICLETEFSDIVEPIFSVPLLEPWYAAGRFPCGWDGEEFPDGWTGVIRDGKLMVF
jgi:hypothetical protein